ncbi:hypothetical protein LPJ56_000767 [Coemansia sp. RSA 2599]|nr:hypothetical protein LPJ75_000254 [Coemansia sp. RSA 2598]KAJ1828945.1 hypothetical protein LPJ56_000767 [Coemansia sp. RSA 2599]
MQTTEYDIVVVEFPEINLDAKVVERAAIYDGKLQAGQRALIVGRGGAEKGVNTNVLRGAINIIGKPEVCGIEDNNGPGICLSVDLTPGVAACRGDSGSGMFVNDSGHLKLIGFDSVGWGGATLDCGSKGAKHLYVNVLYSLDFIQQTTGLSREYLVGRSGDAS